MAIMINRLFQLVFVIYFLVCQFISTSAVFKDVKLSSVQFTNDCTTCKQISDRFIQGYQRTAKSNFGGGNTEWEEKKLKGYAKSETRLIEILEDACEKSETHCSTFLEKYEDDIEEWYQKSSPKSLDTFSHWLCNETANACCPEGTFGKTCERCPHGDNGLACSGHGFCDGDGSTSGEGFCICHAKYNGENCSNCDKGYAKSLDEDNKEICADIDECRANWFLSPCMFYKCNNTEGEYICYDKPFYQQTPKISTLAVLLLTASIFMYKEMYGLGSLTCIVTSVLLILFAKNIL